MTFECPSIEIYKIHKWIPDSDRVVQTNNYETNLFSILFSHSCSIKICHITFIPSTRFRRLILLKSQTRMCVPIASVMHVIKYL